MGPVAESNVSRAENAESAGPRVVAVVVTFCPNIPELLGLIRALHSQVAAVILVDNGSHGAVRALVDGKPTAGIVLIETGDNLGVAAAQNLGIAMARKMDATHVALFDQDSLPSPDMINILLAAAERLERNGVRVACVGPRYVDPRQENPPPFIRIEGVRLVRCRCEGERDVVSVDYLISSGSLIPVSALSEVGDMCEALFIDYVDIEWGLRAKSFGFRSYGVCAAKMVHSLGESPILVGPVTVPVHSPLRHFYLFRNSVWMWRRSRIPLNWKLVDAYRLPMKFVFYALFAKPRRAHVTMMLKGVWYGLAGRMGRLDA